MPERSNGAVSKTVDLGNWIRGFESLSLRQKNNCPAKSGIFYYPTGKPSSLERRQLDKKKIKSEASDTIILLKQLPLGKPTVIPLSPPKE